MKKRLTAIILIFALYISISGCSSFIERDYLVSAEHKSSPSAEVEPVEPVAAASNYAQLRDAIATMVNAHEEHGVIHLIGYENDVENDVLNACMEVANNTPMGAYAVYYISSSVSKIVSYYEADITITYKRTAEHMAAVSEVTNEEELHEAVRTALQSYDMTLAFSTQSQRITEDSIISCIEELYYSDPGTSVTHPETTISVYPQSGSERIYEISFAYKYLKSSLEVMRERLAENAASLVSSAADMEGADALHYIVDTLCSGVSVVEKNWDGSLHDIPGVDDTAYGAIVRGSATSEGFAMALKLVCDSTGIECEVVRGRRGSADSAWNIVNIGGDWYHVDACRCAEDGISAGFLKNDAAMSDEYVWDTAKYPQCSGDMTYMPGVSAWI